MGSNQRLLKIETALTPQQAILLWIKEAHSHPTMENYAKWLSENPETRSPFRFGEKCVIRIKAPTQFGSIRPVNSVDGARPIRTNPPGILPII